jgi:hypothetical protein
MFKKYIIISGILLVVVLVLSLIFNGVMAVDALFGIGVLCAIVFFTFPLYRKRLGSWGLKIVRPVLFVTTFFTNLIAIFFIVFAIANIPKGKPFEEKVFLEPAPMEEQEAYITYTSTIGSRENPIKFECTFANKKWIENHYDGSEEKLEEELLSEKCIAERKEFLDFHRNNITSFPLSKYDPSEYYSLPYPNFLPLQSLCKTELTAIAMLLYRGEKELAQEKYIQLWEVGKNLLSGKESLIKNMIATVWVSLLIDFYDTYGSELQLENNEKLINILAEIPDKMDKSFQACIALEYIGIKGLRPEVTGDFFIEAATGLDEEIFPSKILKPMGIRWPFFDKYKTLKSFHDATYDFVTIAGMPAYKSQKLLSETSERLETQIAQASSGIQLKNPVGNAIFAMGTPNLQKVLVRKEEYKSHIIAMRYLLSVTDPNDEAQIPIDNMTGEKFVVNYEDGILSIQGKEVDMQISREL